MAAAVDHPGSQEIGRDSVDVKDGSSDSLAFTSASAKLHNLARAFKALWATECFVFVIAELIDISWNWSAFYKYQTADSMPVCLSTAGLAHIS